MTQILDTKGLKCPLPVLKVRKALRTVPVGATLTVLATDPLAPLDLQHLCNEAGHDFQQEKSEEDGTLRFVIRRTV